MINLIPNQEKKKMIRGFYYRLTVLILTMLSLSLFIAICALLPSYFLSYSKKNISIQKLEAQKAKSTPLFDQETSMVIKDLSSKINLLENIKNNKFSVSEKIIKTIILKKVPSIKITQISYENNLPEGKKVSIRGTAPSREVLLLFRKALEGGPSFRSVDLPISNFVKGFNIQFYLSLIPV